MKLKPIINSLADNDLYKFNMGQVFFRNFRNPITKYEFNLRNYKDIKISKEMYEEILCQIKHLCSLKFTPMELYYFDVELGFHPEYIDFLSEFSFDESYINLTWQGESRTIFHGSHINLEIEGPINNVTLYEVPLLAIINEVYYRFTCKDKCLYDEASKKGMKILKKNMEYYISETNGKAKFIEFGTRRRRSFEYQKGVLEFLIKESNGGCIGTSNVKLSIILKIDCKGTMAHEYFQFFQAHAPIKDFIKVALDYWIKEFRGKQAIALTDIITTRAFLKDFDYMYAKFFDGLRQDSGDPREWARMVINHYQSIKIPIKNKIMIFSDGLNLKKSVDLWTEFSPYFIPSSGIGTNFTNNVGLVQLNIVLKMVECRGMPVAKISDSPRKGMCKSNNYVNFLKEVFKI